MHAYCLMTNHVHLLISPGPDAAAVSSFMRLLAGRQTRYVNRKQQRSGTLWEGRFKASLVDTSNYLLACYRYIDLNPVRAGLIEYPEDYEWSSCRHNTGIARTEWLEEHPVMLELDTDPTTRHVAYARFIRESVEQEELEFISTRLQRNQVTGKRGFHEELERRTARRLSTAGPGRPEK